MGATVTIATTKAQVPVIYDQLGEDVNLSVEPCRRDTFPAIALAVAYLHDVKMVSEDEVIVICPVDSFVDEDYFETIKALGEQAQKGEANLVLMGIQPAYPSEKFGYIIPESMEEISWVSAFKEKLDIKTAKGYISQGALWNGGVFATKMRYVLERAHELIHYGNYEELLAKYATLEKISFDYAIVENEPKIQVLCFKGLWRDVGTWNTLIETMEVFTVGKATLSERCNNVNVINELNLPIVCMGIKDIIVSASLEGILVSDRKQSDYIKPYVDKIE